MSQDAKIVTWIIGHELNSRQDQKSYTVGANTYSKYKMKANDTTKIHKESRVEPWSLIYVHIFGSSRGFAIWWLNRPILGGAIGFRLWRWYERCGKYTRHSTMPTRASTMCCG